MIRHEYHAYKESPPPQDVCGCVRDVEHNGIRKALRFIALAVREPAIVYDAPNYAPGRAAYYVPYSVTYHFGSANEDRVLLTQAEAMPNLADQASWDLWVKLLTSMDPNAHKDTALFLYCSLNA